MSPGAIKRWNSGANYKNRANDTGVHFNVETQN